MVKQKNSFPKWIFVVGGILIVILMIGMWIGGTYNSLVAIDEKVNTGWANVQTDYQRRADLVPNLVATVKASSDFETNILTEVTNARAGISSAKTPAELEEAGQQITTAINVVVEAYPEIKSTEAYADLMVSLEGTENRIKVARNDYNEVVKQLNTKVRVFPTNIIAGMFGFSQREYFEAAAGTDTVPSVKDGFNE